MSNRSITAAPFVRPQHLIDNGDTTILDLYDWNAVHNTNAPLLRFVDNENAKTLSWAEVNEASHHAAAILQAQWAGAVRHERPVLAIFANTDFITLFTAIVGGIRAGFTVFPISPRNSPEALASLLLRTEARFVLVSKDLGITSVMTAAKKIYPSTSMFPVPHDMPTFEELYAPNSRPASRTAPCLRWALDDPQLIMHSSGSTAFPNPVVWTARGYMTWALAPNFGEVDLNGVAVSCHSIPMFHAMGMFQIGAAAVSGCIVTTFPPAQPPIFPTADTVFKGARATGADLITVIPAFLEEWSRDPTKIEYLARMKLGVVFGGAPLLKECGDMLVAGGVQVRTLYGSSEAGIMGTYCSVNRGMDWQYVKFTEQMQHILLPREDETYELVMAAKDGWKPAKVNAEHEGRVAFGTNDLFVPHPEKPGLWKLHGRVDDQIVLSTGEKTNPGPLEAILAQDPHIRAAVIFGSGRTQNGVIIDPVQEFKFDVEDELETERFIDKIWPVIERANAYAPQHSRLFKEMLIFSAPDRPFSFTGKGTTRRLAIINAYSQDIEALYQNHLTHKVITPPPSWDASSTLDFVRSVVHKVLGRQVDDNIDIFQCGCDSLQATWIFNQIKGALRGPGSDVAAKLPQSCIYQAPTIVDLSALVSGLLDGHEGGNTDVAQAKKLHELIERYTSGFPTRPTLLRERADTRDVVLVTGTTGGLGCHILRHLLLDPSVAKVIAVNRSSSSLEAQRAAFRDHGLDTNLIDSSKLWFICGSMNEPLLGLTTSIYNELQETVTHVVLNGALSSRFGLNRAILTGSTAWKVNFNQTVASFEDLLVGTRTLVDMCLTSPYKVAPRIIFASSVGVFKESNTSGHAVEEHIDEPIGVVAAQGYAESKWVAEQILAVANRTAGLQTVTVRIGQLCGAENGHWNEREWFPSLVKSAQHVGCLPAVDGDVTWVPLDAAALALTQMRNSNQPVLHLAHSRGTPWNSFVGLIAKRLQVPLVPYSEWLTAMESNLRDELMSEVDTMRKNPALRLMDFFRSVRFDETREPLGIVYLDTRRAQQVAPALSLCQLQPEIANKWLAAWRASNFIIAN